MFLDGGRVGLPAIAADMEVAKGCRFQFADERVRMLVGAASHVPANEKLCRALNRGERVAVAATTNILFADRGRALAKNILPDFVHLDVINVDALNVLLHILIALRANVGHQVEDRALGDASDSGSSQYAHSLAK